MADNPYKTPLDGVLSLLQWTPNVSHQIDRLFIDSEVIESLYGSSFTHDLFNTELQPQPFINELQRLMKVL